MSTEPVKSWREDRELHWGLYMLWCFVPTILFMNFLNSKVVKPPNWTEQQMSIYAGFVCGIAFIATIVAIVAPLIFLVGKRR